MAKSFVPNFRVYTHEGSVEFSAVGQVHAKILERSQSKVGGPVEHGWQ